MRAKKLRVLLDVDGVLGDFLGSALQVVEQKCLELNPPHTTKYTRDHILTWDIFDHVPREVEDPCRGVFNQEGFCKNIEVLAGSQEGVRELQKISDVVIVTSPMDTPFWVWERTNWLKDHFGFSSRNIIHCSSKFMVRGDVLIDDRLDNVRDWSEHHPEGLGVVWAAPYNRNETLPPTMVRTATWEDVLMFVESHARGLK